MIWAEVAVIPILAVPAILVLGDTADERAVVMKCDAAGAVTIDRHRLPTRPTPRDPGVDKTGLAALAT